MKTFRDEIVEYLGKTGTKPYLLATMAGVPWAGVYRFLKGKGDLQLRTVERLKEAMGGNVAGVSEADVAWTRDM